MKKENKVKIKVIYHGANNIGNNNANIGNNNNNNHTTTSTPPPISLAKPC